MDDIAPDFLDFNDFKLCSISKTENVLKLDDPPDHDSYVPINAETLLREQLTRSTNLEEISDNFLELEEPPLFVNDNIPEFLGSLETNMFDNKFVEPMETEVIAKPKIEGINETDILNGNENSMKVEDFEIVKKEEVDNYDACSTDSEEIIRQSKHLVINEDSPLCRSLASEDILIDNFTYSDMAMPSLLGDMSENVQRSTDTCQDSIMPCDSQDSFNAMVFTTPGPHEYLDQCSVELESFMPSFVRLEPDIIDKCRDIVTWVQPVTSATVFGLLMFAELGIMMECSTLSLMASSAIMCLLASIMHKVAVRLGCVNTQSSTNCVVAFNKEDIDYCMDVTFGLLTTLYHEIRSIAYVDSITKNFKALALLWALTYLGQMFNLQSLIFIGSLCLFSVPLVYRQFNTDIDELCYKARGYVDCSLFKMKSAFQ